MANWQDARGCHGREERAFSGLSGHLTSFCLRLLEEEPRSPLTGRWRGGGYQRWKRGLGQGMALCGRGLPSYCLKNWGSSLSLPSSLTLERMSRGLWGRTRGVFMSSGWIRIRCFLNLWFLQSPAERAQSHPCQWRESRPVAGVYCIQKRCPGCLSAPTAVFCFTCSAVLSIGWLHIFSF